MVSASAEEDYIRTVRRALDERDLTSSTCADGAHIWEDDPDAREAQPPTGSGLAAQRSSWRPNGTY